ncbi:hypothetical protein D3C80_1190540 [compost metagenome]
MSEVQRFQQVADLCKSSPEMLARYPMATQYVLAADYDALRAELEGERQASRDKEMEYFELQAQLEALKAENVELKLEASGVENAKAQLAEILGCADEPRWKWIVLAAEQLRARVMVVPDRKNRATTIAGLSYDRGWNACLDALARLNGKTVSERLLRALLDADYSVSVAAAAELRALLDPSQETVE